MNSTIWLVVGGMAVVLVIWKAMGPSLNSAANRAVKEGKVDPLLKAIGRLRSSAQPDAFNGAIRQLWDDYQRPLAIPLIRALVQQHSDAPIAQYWLRQVQEVEPELASESFDREFLEAHYQPAVAASCGESG